MNYHIEILFDDGITWLARIRRSNATSPPAELRDYILRSEVSTLQFLSETKVPAPKVFDFNFCETNPIGVGYILMEKLPGSSLRWSLATPEQRRRVTSQVADVYIELYAHPFAMTGSIHHPGSHDVGPFARETLTEYQVPR
jgi:aminoglycoside phosphotransferase (APT) family kinase protein